MGEVSPLVLSHKMAYLLLFPGNASVS